MPRSFFKSPELWNGRRWRCSLLLGSVLALPGCAIHHYDAKTGTEHLWGFGHMKMRVTEPHEGVRAVVRSTEQIGVSLSTGAEEAGVAAGWHARRRLTALNENTAISLTWPHNSFFNVRVGTNLPPELFGQP